MQQDPFLPDRWFFLQISDQKMVVWNVKLSKWFNQLFTTVSLNTVFMNHKFSFKPCKLTDLQKEICEGVSVSKGSFFPPQLMQRTFNEIKQILESAWILHCNSCQNSLLVHEYIFWWLLSFLLPSTYNRVVCTNCLIKKGFALCRRGKKSLCMSKLILHKMF